MKKTFLTFLWLIAIPFFTNAQVTLPKVIGDNMVLQQGKEVKIWGKAAPNEKITVKFQRQVKKTTADSNGDWTIELDKLKATPKPQTMTIKGKNDNIRLHNILIGEVWLASGQSNMEYSMNNHPKYAKPHKGNPERLKEEFKQANSPLIRVMHIKKDLKSDTLPSTGWQILNESSLAPVSAAGYFFAKKLTEELNVPVGIISSSWGGTRIETWTPEEGYAQSSQFREKLTNHKIDNHKVGERYEKMIAPLAPYTLRGFLWYQGESNLIDNGPSDKYVEKKRVLIESWRTAWNDQELPFYYVQLAPYTYSTRRNDYVANAWDALPIFWEKQTACLNIPHTGMIVTTDLVDNAKDIHPSYKWIVGERLALLALAKSYGKDTLEYSGPTYQRMETKGNQVTLYFDHAKNGLFTKDGKSPDWFMVKTNNGKFSKPQSATIKGNTVILTHDKLASPAAVRFAWDEIAMPNLTNKEGLPAVPFRVGN